MYNKQAFEAGHKGNCGHWGGFGRGRFGGPWGRGKAGGFWGGRHGGWFQQVPVNIEETDTDYTISLFAPALVKEHIKLAIKNDVLTISYEGTESPESAETQTKYTYQEYGHRSFERSFQLNNKVLTETISAVYTDGVLKVVLPKNPETNQPAQTISVA
ncbi:MULTISPECIES: Hsp20/alpha crystallin family protein [unclassified Spirosoma]|uniref:Hsp20/alpha crystallin family protein n=1 Tax=unclassified Spirosoma TaxID=2621999 RepID=UPI00095FB3FC|nr:MULTISPECIES: Hsp20/alpha crystallin family protein [unclassified Spirosoma]MBN8825600.1 Hsp20/alpha crystallin family protein [Spirosoma sp.]OJW71695.1 MAG: heat-shock protein Hsp20 [Spirosoma sp. 48-14]